MAYKPSKLGQTDPVLGMCLEFISRIIAYNEYDADNVIYLR